LVPQEIARKLHRDPKGVGVDLTRTIYRYVKQLVGQPQRRLGRWYHVPAYLTELGYRRPGAIADAQAPGYLYSRLSGVPAGEPTPLQGREALLTSLLEQIQHSPLSYRLAIEGIGGMGKTRVALTLVQQLASDPHCPYDQVVWMAVQAVQMTQVGALPSFRAQQTLQQVVRELAVALDCDYVTRWPLMEQIATLYRCLDERSALIVIDGLDTLASQPEMLSFLQGLPMTTGVLVTTRDRLGILPSLQLAPLPVPTVVNWIQSALATELISGRVTEEQVQAIARACSGIPAAVQAVIAEVRQGGDVAVVLPRLGDPHYPVAQRCFQQAIAPLREQPAHRLLGAIALFPTPVPLEIVAQVAGILAADREAALAMLRRRSLIDGPAAALTMLTLTRDYVRSDWGDFPEVETDLRQRWWDWGQATAAQHGQGDRLEWANFQKLATVWPQVCPLLDAPIVDLDAFWHLWRYLRGYTHFAGYWHERLRWMEASRSLAQDRQDWARVAESVFDWGWTLALFARPQDLRQAIGALDQAWILREHCSSDLWADVVINQARIHTQLGELATAQTWLHRGDRLLALQKLSDLSATRLQIQLYYYRAETERHAQNWTIAQDLYQRALVLAQEISWQRATAYTRGWLGELARCLGDWPQAEQYLRTSEAAAAHYGDRRCLAYCRRSLAQLAGDRGHPLQLQTWGQASLREFQALGMTSEATALQTWLDQQASRLGQGS
jgi:LuxR family glucitol operon transcriptional activator